MTDVYRFIAATDDRLDKVAFGDNVWHHVTLVRSGDSLTLAVDGTAEAPATLGDGALTATDTFAVDGLSLGGKLDGSQPLTGSLDEVRLYRQALSTSDLTLLQGSTGPTDAAPVLWLPFDTIARATPACSPVMWFRVTSARAEVTRALSEA